MKHLFPTSDEQTIKIIPRVYTTSIILKLRDDSSNDTVSFVFPTVNIAKGYLELTNVFDLKEGRFYDLKIYEVKGDYKAFKERVIADGGTFVNNTCLYNFLDAKELINTSDVDIIYRDKIFCTAQLTSQAKNEYYSVNKDEYKPKSGNNNFIIL
jgi:hypothetical protein